MLAAPDRVRPQPFAISTQQPFMSTQQAIVVQKFGGSSVADVTSIRRVAAHAVATRRSGKRVVVVVSAMGKTTDSLVNLAHEVTSTPDRREMDMLLTAGERIAMAILAMAIRDLGEPATSLTGSQCGIITNDAPGGARIVEVRPFRVQDALDAGQIVIVAGFQGVSWRKEVTTLGRGGSDTTAVALAAALSAEACEIYSDVDGVYSADPRTTPLARRLDTVGHDEMLAMARAGAKVLGADAVAWARLNDVALYARATDGRPGETIVRVNPPEDRPWIAATAQRPQCALLAWRGDVPELPDILTTFALPPIFSLHLPEQTLLLLGRDVADAVDPQFGRLVARLRQTHDAHGQAPTALFGTLVSIVGPGVGREPDLLTPFRAALAPWLTPQTPVLAHGLTLSCLLPPELADAAVVALHAAFLGGAR